MNLAICSSFRIRRNKCNGKQRHIQILGKFRIGRLPFHDGYAILSRPKSLPFDGRRGTNDFKIHERQYKAIIEVIKIKLGLE